MNHAYNDSEEARADEHEFIASIARYMWVLLAAVAVFGWLTYRVTRESGRVTREGRVR